MTRVRVIWFLSGVEYRKANCPADSVPSEEEMDIDAFEVPVKGEQESYHVDFTLSNQDEEKVMDQDVDYTRRVSSPANSRRSTRTIQLASIPKQEFPPNPRPLV